MQKSVEKFIDEFSLRTNAEIRYIDLVSEVGELGKELIKATNYGKNDFKITEQTAGEIGDCLFSLLALCCELDINAETALESALQKYRRRFEQKGHIDSESG